MAAFSAEAEAEFAPRPGLTLTLDEDEQQVTLAVVRPEDRVRVVAVSLQSSKPLRDVARAVGAQRLFHDGSELDLGEKVDAVHARVARSFKRQTGSPYLLAVCQETTDAAVPPEDLIDETTAAALVVAHVATGGDVRGAAARVWDADIKPLLLCADTQREICSPRGLDSVAWVGLSFRLFGEYR